MNTEVIWQQLQNYIRSAKGEQLEAIYALLENDILVQEASWQEEKSLLILDARATALLDGGMSRNDVKEKLLNRKK